MGSTVGEELVFCQFEDFVQGLHFKSFSPCKYTFLSRTTQAQGLAPQGGFAPARIGGERGKRKKTKKKKRKRKKKIIEKKESSGLVVLSQ